LHGTALERIQDEPEGPLHIVVNDLIDIGDDLKKGINAVDRVRGLLTDSRHKVKRLKYSLKLRDHFLKLIDH
jgi:hypothetical protein